MINTDLENASKIMIGSQEAEAIYVGSNLIWEEYTGLLPKGYTQLEYISSTSNGGQYIDLNIMLYDTLNKDYDIAIKFNILGFGQDNGKDNGQGFLFGCQNTTNPWPGTFIRINGNSNIVGRYIGGNQKDVNLGLQNTIIELPVQIAPNKNVTNLSNSGQTHTWGTSLFSSFNSQDKTQVSRFVYAKLYYFKLFVEGVLVRDMIPCIDPNNIVGLYDLVNDVFYSSPNGALFVAGSTV